MVEKPGELGSPPDIEANISPLEDYSEGVIVVDGSIPCPKIGLLEDNVKLFVKQGRIVSFFSQNKSLEIALKKMFLEVKDEKAYILAECGIGLNDKCKLTGNMLTDEGAQGTLHFGFGSNHTVGGINKVSFHLDFVIQNPNLWCDEFQCINNGDLNV
jgi:leucyl aminopeptidase (aminopeptidase T)